MANAACALASSSRAEVSREQRDRVASRFDPVRTLDLGQDAQPSANHPGGSDPAAQLQVLGRQPPRLVGLAERGERAGPQRSPRRPYRMRVRRTGGLEPLADRDGVGGPALGQRQLRLAGEPEASAVWPRVLGVNPGQGLGHCSGRIAALQLRERGEGSGVGHHGVELGAPQPLTLVSPLERGGRGPEVAGPDLGDPAPQLGPDRAEDLALTARMLGVAPDRLEAVGRLAERERRAAEGHRRCDLERLEAGGERLRGERRGLGRRSAGQGDGQGGHRGQRAPARAGSARSAPHIVQGTELGGIDRTERRSHEAHRAQPVPQVVEPVGQLAAGLAGEFHALRGRSHEQQKVTQPDRRTGAFGRVGQPGVRRAQRLDAGRTAQVGGAAAELEREGGLLLGGRRLGLGALQQSHRRIGRPPAQRKVRGLAQARDHPGVGAGWRQQQLRRDPLGGGAEAGEQPGRTLVLERAFRRRQSAVHGVADQRMDEAERLVGAEDLRASESLHGPRGARLVGAGERSDRGQAGLLPEHRHGAGHCHRRLWEAGEPEQHRARHGPRADGPYLRGSGGARRDLLGGQGAEQLTKEQRVAGRDVVTGRGEGTVGVLSEARAEQLSRGLERQRTRGQRERDRLLSQLAEQHLIGVGLARADRRRDQDVEGRERRARYAMNRSDAGSLHCRSSMHSTSGRAAARRSTRR